MTILSAPSARSLALLASCCLPAKGQSPNISELSELTASYRSSDDPGGVLAAAIDGDLVHLESFGLLSAGKPEPITADSRFYIASTAKMFTASCVHLLAEADQLDLDERLSTYLPELTEAAPGITLRQMLHHRSGLRDFYEMGFLLAWDLEEPPPRDEVVALIARQRGLNFAPGSSAMYSNSNYLLLAMVVEKVSGMPFEDFAEKRLFAELGMTNTEFGIPDPTETSNLATPHINGAKGFEPRSLRNRLLGAGGAWSTAEDLLRFARIFYADRWSNLAAALTAGPELDASQWLSPILGDYRAGIMHRDPGGIDVFFHFGGYMGAQANLLIVPELGLSIAVVTNRQDIPVQNLGMAVAAVLGAEASEEPAASKGVGSPANMRSLMRGGPAGAVAILTIQGQRGVFQGLGMDLRLAPLDPQRLRVRDASFPMEIALDKDTRQVELRSPGKNPQVYAAISMDPFTAPDAEATAGLYYSAELDAELELLVEGKQLALRDRGYAIPVLPFRALSRDVHVSSGRVMILIEVERGQDDEILSLILGTNRAQGIRFVKR